MGGQLTEKLPPPGAGAGIGDDAASQHSGEIPWARLDVFAEAWSAKVNESCGSIANGKSP